MSAIGYKDKAVIYTLEDEKIQVIRCRKNSKKIISSNFIGNGRISQGQTFEICTKNKLSPKCLDGQARCVYKGVRYLIVGRSSSDVSAINNPKRAVVETVLFLR